MVIDLIEMEQEILSDLFADQNYLYDIVTAPEAQRFPLGLKHRRLDPTIELASSI